MMQIPLRTWMAGVLLPLVLFIVGPAAAQFGDLLKKGQDMLGGQSSGSSDGSSSGAASA